MADKRKKANLEVVHPNCAGIDIGKKAHYVAVDPERLDEPVRNFGTFTRDLTAMAAWLRSCGVDVVAMEATGVYWIPVFEVLERSGFEVHLVNPPRDEAGERAQERRQGLPVDPAADEPRAAARRVPGAGRDLSAARVPAPARRARRPALGARCTTCRRRWRR